jgi:tetratricopeptide (TPR) repeat protein
MHKQIAPIISRTANHPSFSGIYAATLATLQKSIAQHFPRSSTRNTIFADLSLGAWQTHQVATEFCKQMGIIANFKEVQNLPSLQTFPCYADIIGAGVDAEAMGDRSITTALSLVTQVAIELQQLSSQLFLVIAPRFNLAWEPENIYFLEFLHSALVQSDSQLIIICVDSVTFELPINWSVHWLNQPETSAVSTSSELLRLIPGIVDLDITINIPDQITPLVLLKNHLLIPLELRQDPQQASRFDYDGLGIVTKSRDWLEAYTQVMGNTFYIEPSFLCTQAWKSFAAGSYSLAFRLMERAVFASREPQQQGVFQCQLQGMRIALQHFPEVSKSNDPSPAIPQQLQGFLWQAKAWGLVMTYDNNTATTYLQKAQQCLGLYENEQEFLYLLNISALNQFRLGNLDQALQMEQEIEVKISQLNNPEYRLVYINSLNLARIYCQQEQFDLAKTYYQKAFATTLGAKTESDLIYANICLAQLNTLQNSSSDAFFCWLRASLHWVSSSIPEAVGARVIRSLIKQPLLLSSPETIEAFSTKLFEYLYNSIERLSNFLNIPTALELDTSPPNFVRAECLNINNAACFFVAGGEGWSVLGSIDSVAIPFNGQAHQQLRALLFYLLQKLCPRDDWLQVQTIAIDNQLGYEMALTLPELINTGLRWQVAQMFWYDQEIQFSGLAQLTQQSLVSWNEAISHITFTAPQPTAFFKRYLPPKPLTFIEQQALAELYQPRSLIELTEVLQLSFDDCLLLVQSLEQVHLIHRSLPNNIYDSARLVSSCI